MNLRRLKIAVVSIIIFGLVLTLSACDMGNGNDVGDEDNGEELVWETFSNDFFSFDYPGPWEELDEGYVVMVSDGLEEEEPEHAFTSMYVGQELNEQQEEDLWEAVEEDEEIPDEFEEDFIEGFSETYGEEVEFDYLKVSEFNDYISIEGEGSTVEEDELKINLVLFYHEGENSILISYMAPEEHYSEEIKEEIYSSYEVVVDENNLEGGELIEIDSNPEAGFYWDYFLYIPEAIDDSNTSGYSEHMLVVPNNTGTSSDDYEKHKEEAKNAIENFSFLGEELNVPMLVPTFPRPDTIDEADKDGWAYYTHALNRNTLKLEVEEYERIDKQLLSMIDHAQEGLAAEGINMDEQVFLKGFSASGTYVNRFIKLHPDRVQAITAGGINGLPTLPLEEANNEDLMYSVGINDLQSLVDLEFDLDTYKDIPQYLYMGGEDANDTLPYDDAYTEEEREIIINVFKTKPVKEDTPENAEILIDRFNKAEKYYEANDIPAQFEIYEGIGHEFSAEIFNDIIEFYKQNANNSLDEI